MGVQHVYGALATGGGFSLIPGWLQPSYEESWHNFKWSQRARSIGTRRDTMSWRSKWSYGCSIGYGDVSGGDGAAPLGSDLTWPNYYNPPMIQDGSQSIKFIKGLCVDTSDSPLSGVNVRAYVSSTNAYAGYDVQSRTDGSYDVPTPNAGVNHYVVAYLPGSPDRGATTLNTLVPTNIDGT